MDGIVHKVFVAKRPGVDEFLEEMAKHYELIIFTASLDKVRSLHSRGLITVVCQSLA
jgi:TFIIF-interacting CTD phosphatase-like protein